MTLPNLVVVVVVVIAIVLLVVLQNCFYAMAITHRSYAVSISHMAIIYSNQLSMLMTTTNTKQYINVYLPTSVDNVPYPHSGSEYSSLISMK